MAQLNNTQVIGNLNINGTLSIDEKTGKIDKTVFNLIYPKGTIYWTNDKLFNPNSIFGGTWKRIENTFILAGDHIENKLPEGNENGKIKLTIDQLPSHTHNISHTHKYKPEGIIKSHSTGISVDNNNFNVGGGSHWHYITGTAHPYLKCTYYFKGQANGYGTHRYYNDIGTEVTNDTGYLRTREGDGGHTHNASHSHSITDNGHTHDFTGTEKIISDISTSVSGSTGSGSEINIMPPYIVKYCWERTN